MTETTLPTVLSWHRNDIEERCGFRGARFTRVNNYFTLLIAVVGTAALYGCLIPFPTTRLAAMFTERGPTPYFIVFLSVWSLAILLVKRSKVRVQALALSHEITPAASDFVLSTTTVDEVTHRIFAQADDPRRFILFNRILWGLSNLRNIGRIADVDDILRSQAEQDESSMETSYAVVQGFIWGIPVLGFIGTVLGLSDAISAFGDVLGASSEMSQITGALREVTSGLNTAFDTTLEALVAAIVIQFLLTFVKKGEEEFLDSCAEYCTRQVVSKLRVLPYEMERTE